MDRIHTEAQSKGLDTAAADAELEITTTDPFQESFNIPGVPNSLPGTRFAFSNDAGSLSPVFESQEMFYFFEVAERIPAGYRDLDDVRAVIASRLQRDQRADIAAARLAEAWDLIQAGATLGELAKDDQFSHAVTDTFTLRENIPGVGYATAFARAALSLEPGQILPEVRTQRGVYIVKLLYKSDFDEAGFEAQRASLARTLLFNRQRQTLMQWQEQLREKADVEDLRGTSL
jgi:parvulin-like peptidyl-prolyl isomerase